ncbi:maleylpyruvate isomerase N-terminal domain-containing protein [Pedococcus sp. 5OH_020]|uniref:maleylpyruvate isomerase N-terminal domain-containing protein n=1 Tax=Pedococcus sp. 5OH_020 TaxID=2989814 RepID=UPI0022E9BF53|nr:maleylpyruvate isomerase N-terminal domain-containing protein [Pedococcus sp. 5OH_020]
MTSAPGPAAWQNPTAWQGGPAAELLDRAVAYTAGCLALVGDGTAGLDRRTPCRGWTLKDLLLHLDDSLAALTEAAGAPVLSLVPVPRPAEPGVLLSGLRQRACALVAQWMRPASPVVRLGSATLSRETLGAVGALEITLHGWDVAETVGLPRPIPATLAMDLWPVARDHITEDDRPTRFGRPLGVGDADPPAVRLLAHAGRRAL